MNKKVLLKIQGVLIVLGGLFIALIGVIVLLFEYGNNMYDDHQAYIRDMFIFWSSKIFLLIFLIICILSAYFGIKQKYLSQHIIAIVSSIQLFGMAYLIWYTSPYDTLQDTLRNFIKVLTENPRGHVAFTLVLSHIIMNIGVLVFAIKTIMKNNNLLQATDA